MHWILTSLNGCAIDVHHIIIDGELLTDGGYLIAAKHPSRPSHKKVVFSEGNEQLLGEGTLLSYLSVSDIATMTARVGAWATVMTSASEQMQQSHRVILDSLARGMPGVYVSHRFTFTHRRKGVKSIYEWLSGQRTAPIRQQTMVTYCHQNRVTNSVVWPNLDVDFDPGVREAYINVKQAMDVRGATPAWLAASQRYLEGSVSASLNVQVNNNLEAATQQGTQNALRFLANILSASSTEYIAESERIHERIVE
jgi:hypothetical protein